MFKAGPLFAANYQSSAETLVNQGGTSSGKTYAILQVLFTKLSEMRRKVCTVVGQDIPNLKAGALRDGLDIYNNSEQLKSLIKSYNKSERIFEFHNGCVMEFKSYEDSQDAKSGKRDFLFVNEAQGIPKPIYDELELRTKEQAFIDYNPNAEFWVHDKVLGRPGVQMFITDHRHNPFLMEKQRAKIEGLKAKDPELWKVYARGLTGKIEGLVLRNWTVVEDDAIPLGARFLGRGIDFGFTNDPTTAIDVYLAEGQLWADEVLYQEGLTNPDIHRELLKADPIATAKVTIADSAEPKSIEELRRLGFKLIEPALKGPDSVRAGLEILQRYHLNVTRRSVMLRKELSNYKWRVDRLTGRPTNEPVDAFNHCFVATQPVTTAWGEVPICWVREGDLVLTRNGYRPVLRMWKTAENQPVFKYNVSCSVNDYSVSCTSNHQVLTQDGWTQIRNLKPGDTIWTPKNSTAKSTASTKESGISPVAVSGFTAWCGSIITGLYRKAAKYTTSTATRTITTLATSNYSKLLPTLRLMLSGVVAWALTGLSETLTKSGHSPKHGTLAKKAGASTLSKLKQRALGSLTYLKNRVSNVVLASSQPLTTPAFVATTAKPSIDGLSKWTSKLAPVLSAVGSSELTSIPAPELVPQLVLGVSVEPIGKQDVYDLHVATDHEFVAGGILVHNCIDPLRYVVLNKLPAALAPRRRFAQPSIVR